MYDYCLEGWVDGMVSRTVQRGAYIPDQEILDVLYVKFPVYLIAIEDSCIEDREQISEIITQISDNLFEVDNGIIMADFMATEFLFQWTWANNWGENSCRAALLLSTDFILSLLNYSY